MEKLSIVIKYLFLCSSIYTERISFQANAVAVVFLQVVGHWGFVINNLISNAVLVSVEPRRL